MLPKANKKIKSPFFPINSSSESSHNNDYNSNYNQNQNNNILSLKEKYLKLNTSSDFIKTSFTTFPKTSYLKRDIKIPFFFNLSPLSNNISPSSIPLIDYSESYEIPCCKNQKCQAFLNPFVEFINGGNEWKCNLCKKINKVSEYYFSPLDENGVRLDQKTKPELNNGTYEFINYKYFFNKNNIITPCYYFLIDISKNGIDSGFSQCVLESIKNVINNNFFYNYENCEIKICIITYEEKINFYPINIINDNVQNINMLSINETSDNLFIPTNKDFLLVNLKKYKNKLIQIIENIENYISSEGFNSPKESKRFFDVIKICNLIGENIGGKILIFNGSNISQLDLMNNNENINTLTDYKKLKYKLTDNGKIGKLGISLSLHNLGVNIFQSCKTYTNVKTQNQLVINTNGNFFFYRNFSSELHYKNIYNQIQRILLNQNIYEGCLKFNFSHKIGIKDYITPVLLYNKEIIFFPNLDSDQNYSFILELNYQNDYQSSDNYTINDDFTFIQMSLFYNREDGKKIIRVFNYCLPVSNAKDIYDSINPEVLGAMSTQKLIMDIYKNQKLVESVNNFEKIFFEIFNAYFNNINMNYMKKEINEEMKIYSLYVLGILKNCLFNKNDKGINNDDDLTNFYYSKMQKIKIEEILCFIYPRIYCLDNLLNTELNDDDNNDIPPIINDNKESLNNNGNIFLIDNGFNLILYLKNSVDNKIIFDFFNVDDIHNNNFETINEGNIFDYSENKNEIKNKINKIIDNIRNTKSVFQNLKIIFEGINDQKGKIINENLIEDNYNKDYPINFDKFFNNIIFE